MTNPAMTNAALLTALEETWSAVRREVDGIAEAEWSRPTPCSEWDVHDLVAHVGGLEGQFQGLPQPPAPEGWVNPHHGLDAWTAEGVAARRAWPHGEVAAELERAADAAVGSARSLADEDWAAPTVGPLGETTRAGLARVRIYDVYVHLQDLRHALGRPAAPGGEPVAARVATDWVVNVAGWAAAKKAKLADGTRVRIELSGAGGRAVDVVVDGGKGRLSEPDGDRGDRIEGEAVAFLMLASGRRQVADAIGGVKAAGVAGVALLDAYQLF